jgi:electron transfer flavoprotein-quinone oxidoreductase
MSESPNYDNKFDAIVVGGGLAGSAAALTMSRDGLDVIMIERGETPGSKNVFGGMVFTPTLRDLVDLEEAPLERYMAEKYFGFLSEEDETGLSIKPAEWHDEPHNDTYTVLRGSFDRWFAEQAVEAGTTLITETTVTGLVRDADGKISGVETDRPDGTLRAPVVVLAEGANSLVSERAGLKETDSPDHVAVSAKEVRKFDKETINDRFHLLDDEAGAARHYFGTGACGNSVGGGFVYTNKDTISIGVVYRIKDAQQGLEPEEVLNDFKRHPAVAPLVRGGRLVEYSAHAIPEGGYGAMPDLVHDGAVIAGDAAGMVLNNGIHLEGTNLAVESGFQAGKVIAEAIEEGHTDASALAPYATRMENSYVIQNLKQYDWFLDTIAEDKEFLFEDLPSALADAETKYFMMDREPKGVHTDEAKDRLLEAAGGWFGAAKRAWKYRRMLS